MTGEQGESDRLLTAAMSVAFRKSLEAHNMRPNELRLAHVLCLDTFDVGKTQGNIVLDDWAKRMNLKDSKGLRPDKVATLLKTLNELGLVDVNPAQATFEPRPDADLWPRARITRARAIYAPTGATTADPAAAELALRDERELPEALTELSRELATRQVQAAAAAQSSEKSDESRRRNPTQALSSEKSDEPVQRLTFNRSNVSTNKRLTLRASDKSDGELVDGIRERVRHFVGENDWHRFWARAGYLWENVDRVRSLENSLDYLAAGVKTGEVNIRSTNGAALWSQAQIDWRHFQKGKEA
jgi:hypothetical protein